jgi:hypothetical protein
MPRIRVRRIGTAVAACILCSALAGAAVMRMTQTVFDMPKEGEVVELEHLHYGETTSADFNTVTMEIKAKEGTDKLLTTWVFSASNSGGKMRQFEVKVSLLDEEGKRISSGDGRGVLPAAAKDQTVKVKVKTDQATLEHAKRVHVQVNWVSH